MARFVVYFLFAGLILSFSGSQAQQSIGSPSSTATSNLIFEVASVKPANPDGHMRIEPMADRFSARRVLMMQLILFAYRSTNAAALNEGIIKSEQIAGLPAWAMSARYDIDAKVAAEQVQYPQQLAPEKRREMFQQMLRSLLADRFGLKVHYKTEDQKVYLLTIKDRTKLKELSPSTNICTMSTWAGNLEFHDCPIDQLAFDLSSEADIGRLVLNKTRLTGTYELRVKWTPFEEEPSDEGPSLITALEEQLGLKLVSARAPVNTLIVDSVEKPSPN